MLEKSWRGFALALVACLLTEASKAEDAAIGIGATSTRAIVADAQGRSLGRLVGPNQLIISYPDGDALLAFGPDGYSPGSSAEFPALGFPSAIFFETTDCSGRGYVGAGPQRLVLALFRRSPEARVPGYTPSGTVFYATRKNVDVYIRSMKAPSVDNQGPCARLPMPTSRASVHPVNTRNVLSFQLPLSIAVRRN